MDGLLEAVAALEALLPSLEYLDEHLDLFADDNELIGFSTTVGAVRRARATVRALAPVAEPIAHETL